MSAVPLVEFCMYVCMCVCVFVCLFVISKAPSLLIQIMPHSHKRSMTARDK